MGRQFTQANKQGIGGFTIVETMLVLAITGVMIAGLLVGLGSSIGAQRYKDSVSTLKSMVQDQYSQIENVANDRDASWNCGSSATPAQGGTGTAPGQTDCVLLGRYMTIEGTKITTATIVGYEVARTGGESDVKEIKDNYTLGVSQDTITNTTLEWGAEIAWPESGSGAKNPQTPRSIAILILRSPNSGTSYTFTSDTTPAIEAVSSATLTDMMVEDTNAIPGQAQRTVCIEPDGVTVPEKFALSIGQAANGSTSIETRTFATIQSLGGDSKC